MTGTEDLSALGDLAAALPVAVYRTNVDGTFLAGNDALARLFLAPSLADLRAISVRDLYVDATRRDHLITRAHGGESIPTERIELYRLDGSRMWVRVRSRTVRDDDGSIRYFEGVMEDVTALMDAELNPSRERVLLSAVTAMQAGYLAGRDLAALVSDLLRGILGVTRAEHGIVAEIEPVDGANLLRSWAHTGFSWSPDQRSTTLPDGREIVEIAQHENVLCDIIHGGAPVLVNNPRNPEARGGMVNLSSSVQVHSIVGVPIMHGDTAVGVVALINRPGGFDDWTLEYLAPVAATVGSLIISLRADRQRRTAERVQEEIRQLAVSVVEHAADVVVGFDDEGLIVSANAAAGRLCGVAAAELIGLPIARFLPRGRAGRYLARATRARLTGSPIEIEVVTATGQTRVVEATFVLAGAVRPNATVAIGRDIGARKDFERALLDAKESAERASQAKSDLLAGMSHELRTPLNSVIGLAAVLQRQIHGELTEKQHEYIGQIESSGRHLLAIINDILDVSKFNAAVIEPRLEAVPPADVVRSAVGHVRELAAAKSLALEVDVSEDLPAMSADRTRTTQVVINLLANAVKFTPDGGAIRVDAAVQGQEIAISVTDTGIGIPADEHEGIFEAFAQLESSLSRRYPGTGLGLTLSRQIARLQGGDVTVESALGDGSRFIVTVPLAFTG